MSDALTTFCDACAWYIMRFTAQGDAWKRIPYGYGRTHDIKCGSCNAIADIYAVSRKLARYIGRPRTRSKYRGLDGLIHTSNRKLCIDMKKIN